MAFPTVSCTHLKPRTKVEHKIYRILDFLGTKYLKDTSQVSWPNAFGVCVCVCVCVCACICVSMCENVLLFVFLNCLFLVLGKEFCLNRKTH